LAGTRLAAEREDGRGKKKGAGEPGPAALSLLGQGQPIEGGPREPSGIAYHPRSKHLFIVGDEGSLVEVDAAGTIVGSRRVAGNLEDVAVLPKTGELLIVVEDRAELIVLDPGKEGEARRIRLDTAGLLREKPRDSGNGFEGLAFRDDPGLPGGGMLYLVHQRSPAAVVAVAVDLAHAAALGAADVEHRFELPGCENATAATYVARLDRLMVICGREWRMLVMDAGGRVENAVTLPGVRPEGLAFDGRGTLWVADDRAGTVVRHRGALGALVVGLKPTAGARPGTAP
jgi:uncharacterized protein YjiK